jgi:hypothetical protein
LFLKNLKSAFQNKWPTQGRIQDFKLGGAHLKKIAPTKGGTKIFGVFRVKNHDFTQKKSHFFQLRREMRKFVGYFVWKITFFPILGGACPLWIRPCYKCVINPTTIYGSTLDLVFTGGHLPSIIYNGCYCSDHMTLLIQKKMQWLLNGNVL